MCESKGVSPHQTGKCLVSYKVYTADFMITSGQNHHFFMSNWNFKTMSYILRAIRQSWYYYCQTNLLRITRQMQLNVQPLDSSVSASYLNSQIKPSPYQGNNLRAHLICLLPILYNTLFQLWKEISFKGTDNGHLKPAADHENNTTFHDSVLMKS